MKSGCALLSAPSLIPGNWTQINQWKSDYNSKPPSSKQSQTINLPNLANEIGRQKGVVLKNGRNVTYH